MCTVENNVQAETATNNVLVATVHVEEPTVITMNLVEYLYLAHCYKRLALSFTMCLQLFIYLVFVQYCGN